MYALQTFVLNMVALHIIKQEEYYIVYMFHYVESDDDEDLKCYE